MCSHARTPGKQHFHKVYLGCHMQGQGLLTDMISLAAGGKRNTLSSDSLIQPPFFPNSLICLMLETTNDDSNSNSY